MTDVQTISLVIQPAKTVLKDTLRNKSWIIGFCGVISAYVFISTLMFHWLERGQSVGWIQSFYFTVINITTVGFGDVAPKTEPGRLWAVLNSLVGVIAFGLLVAII